MDYGQMQEYVDELEDDADQSQDISDFQAEQYEGATYPREKVEHNMFNWFWRIVGLQDANQIAKVGNLTKTEIGEHRVSMRDGLELAELGRIFNHKKFGTFFATRTKINSITSQALKGWLVEMSITQRKLRGRERSQSAQAQEKWRLFSRKKGIDTGE